MQGGNYCGLLPCKGAINYGSVVLFEGEIAGIVFRSLVRKDEFALFFQGLNSPPPTYWEWNPGPLHIVGEHSTTDL